MHSMYAYYCSAKSLLDLLLLLSSAEAEHIAIIPVFVHLLATDLLDNC